MELVAYNKDDVRARNLLAQAGEDNVLSEKNIHCTASIEITSAYFDDEYKGARCLHRPYMKMIGNVGSVFIEDDDDRVFPCGTKSMTLMTPQQVSINYYLDENEISELALKGLFRENFEVPENLIGNVMEIPLSINYEGIYETPCCIVEIEHPYELQTSSKENSYYGIFNGCRIHDEILREQKDGEYSNSTVDYLDNYEDTDEEEYENYEEQDELAEDLAPELTDEEMEDQAILNKLSSSLQDQISKSNSKKKNEDFDAREFMKELREEVEAEDKDEEQEDVFGLFDEDGTTDKKNKKKKKRDSYEQIKRKMTRAVDVAADNKALNEGITDIAGMGAAEAPATPKKTNPNKPDTKANLAQQLLSGTFGSNTSQNQSESESDRQFL